MGTRKGMDFLEGQNGRTVKTTLENLVLEKTHVSFLYIIFYLSIWSKNSRNVKKIVAFVSEGGGVFRLNVLRVVRSQSTKYEEIFFLFRFYFFSYWIFCCFWLQASSQHTSSWVGKFEVTQNWSKVTFVVNIFLFLYKIYCKVSRLCQN